MKYGKLLQLLLEELPSEYRDKFLSYKQLKKVINTFLQNNSLPAAAFEEAAVAGADGGERGELDLITARDVEVTWPIVEGVEPAAKRVKVGDGAVVGSGEEGKGVDGEGEDDDEEGALLAAVAAGKKRKVGEGIGGVGVVDAGVNVAAVPIEREVLAARPIADRGAAIRARGGDEKELTKEEEEFLRLLNVELEKFNSFFTEKEEDYVIRLQELKHRLERLRQQHGADFQQRDWNEDLLTIRTGLVILHGEVVLMESYSTLNYTGLVKILKKHDKRTGAVLRLPFIRRVLLQPFFSTELLSQLVQECENLLSTFPPPPSEESIDVEPVEAGIPPSESQERSYPEGQAAAGGIFKSTVAALRTIQEMRKGSSTVSAQSLPPCNLNGNDERFGIVVNEGQLGVWSKLLEQSKKREAKCAPESMACAS